MSDMTDYDEETSQEYTAAMAEAGFDEMGPEEGLDAAIDDLLSDLEGMPEKIQTLFDYLLQGYDVADAAYDAGYGNNTEGLHKALKKDTGQNPKDKLRTLKDAHGQGKNRAQEKRAAASG